MLRIFKYPFDIAHDQYIDMPANAVILTCQVQAGNPVIWATVDDEHELVKRHIRVYGTGQAFEGNQRYIGTIQMDAGRLVWHVFEMRSESDAEAIRR